MAKKSTKSVEENNTDVTTKSKKADSEKLHENQRIIDVETELKKFCTENGYMDSFDRILVTIERELSQSRNLSCQHAINSKGKRASYALFKKVIKLYFAKEVK